MLLDSPTFWLTALLLVLTVQETVSHLVVCAECVSVHAAA